MEGYELDSEYNSALDISQLHDQVVEAYEEHKSAMKYFRNMARKVVKKEHEIEMKKAALYEEGLINGRNAEARDAQVRLHLNVEHEELDVLKELEDLAYMRKEQSEIEVEYVRALLRIEELAATQAWRTQ